MRFNRLRLNGFKSFVDPTDLVIHEGLTGVVGPNGCGKSNLLEALRWVMGENRPTAMRGGGMEDVIFAGAASRSARNFAEVSLMIDNSERLAPAGFNDTDVLEVVRRITRDVGSAYKTNGKDVRARDVQMLFADASTGAHSPALVRQGQIAELINSKPKARRRILEEAAGISGLYQRRHEAELKLKGAEANLTRVDDVIEQLAGQLAQLARQARQAARYREIGTALRIAEGVLLYRKWQEADQARALAAEDLSERARLTGTSEAAVRQSATARQQAEDALPPLREEDAVAMAVVQRLHVQRDTLSGEEEQAQAMIDRLTSRIEQLTRDIDREAGLNKDAEDTIARLDWEAGELAKAAEGYDEALADAASAAQDAASVLQQRETALAELTEDVARLAARHQSAQRLVDDTRKTLTRAEGDLQRAQAAVAQAEDTLTRAAETMKTAQTNSEAATAAAALAEATVLRTETERAEAQAAEADARARKSQAMGEASALRAEIDALAKLVAREDAGGAQLLSSVRVASGYEKAFGAALADDLRAPVVETDGSGWRALPNYDQVQPLPGGATPLTDQVTVPDVLHRRLAQIGLVADAQQGAALQAQLQPGQRLVSPEGDLWRWDGFTARAADAPSAAALRLEQMNRLAALRTEFDSAEAVSQEASQAHALCATRLSTLTQEDQDARHQRREADRQVAEASRALSRAESERSMADGKLETLGMAVSRHQDEAQAARQHLREAEAALTDLGDLGEMRGQVDDVKLTVEAARLTMMTKRATHDDLRRQGEARLKRSQQITKEVSGWRHRLETATQRSAELAERRETSQVELKQAKAAPGALASRREELTHDIERAEARRAEAANALAGAETTLRERIAAEREAEREASSAREARAAAEARAQAATETVAQAAERIQEALETTPGDLLETLDVDPAKMPPATDAEADVTRLRRQRDALGAVNLRAEEDAKEVSTEHETLITEKTDLEEAIKTLRSGIASLNREGRERLLAAFDEVNTSFGLLFTHLFGGGEAKLVLVESDDPLEAGLEIMCQPPGKKLSTLSLLSGGEQTLTAMALIFAVFLANPAPICVLDEVDAPLDDNNVTRFCDLLDEMTRRTNTRFLIITHHAVTMARMDRLFGVTMGEQGVSQLVSVDLKRAEALVA